MDEVAAVACEVDEDWPLLGFEAATYWLILPGMLWDPL